MRKRKGAFGVVYQDVTRNNALAPATKGLYAYLASLSGGDDECYPSVDLIRKEMGMSRDAFYKHMSILVSLGIVEKRQVKDGDNRFGRNIYKLTHEVYITEKPYTKNSTTEKPTAEKKYTNNNSYNNNSINNNNININCASDNAPKASRSEINEFFERIWKLYPNKKGKGQVSDAKKKKLYDIGYDEISRAIDRYKDGLLKDDWRKPQNGSTFFNSGYVDYLDANYSKPQDRQEMDAEQQRAQWQRNYEENQQYLRKMLGTPRPTQPDDPFQ